MLTLWSRICPTSFLPKSLFARAMLIIVLPVAIMQVAVMWAFFDRHWVAVTSRLADSVAGDIAVVLDLHEVQARQGDNDRVRDDVLAALNMSIALESDARLPTTVNSNIFRVLDRTLRQALAAKLDEPFWFDTRRYPAYVEIRVQLDRDVMRVIVPRDRVFASTGHIFLLWIIAATVLLTAISVTYIRNQVKPIERLASAAEQFGRGQDAPPIRPSGATEVRQAAAAFLDMRERIERHIDQRTAILAGVSHDLRTPLTRFRLQLALMPDTPERAAMREDVEDMEQILAEYLTFARGVAGEDSEEVDIGELITVMAQSHGIPADITLPVPLEFDTAGPGGDGDSPGLTAMGRPVAIKRCVTNLIENACAFGDQVHVRAAAVNGSIEIAVEDDGPGIAPDLREEAFKPFNQLDREGARTGNRMGYGLGLAIARDIARSHGGDVELGDSPLGGLKASIRLPV